MEFKVGDKVTGKNIFGKGNLSLEVIEVKGNGLFQCQVKGTDVSITYSKDELKKI